MFIFLLDSSRLRRGFTILELLVAMTVTLLLVVGLMRVFTATTNTWQHGEAQVDAYREARAALQLMARDLSATLQASYAPATASASPSPTPAAPLMPTLVLQRYTGTQPDPRGPNNEEVYCLTNIPNHGSSSLCAVGYFCQWMPDDQTIGNDARKRAPRAYALMRQFLDSDNTFLRIKAATTANGSTNPLIFTDLYARMSTDTPPVASVVQLAAYVWDLRFRIDKDLNERTYPDGNQAGISADHSSPPRFYGGDTASQPYPLNLPSYVEIRFKALSATAGRRLEGPNTAVDQSTWKDSDSSSFNPSATYLSVIRPNAQQFILRVPLINATPSS